MAVKKIDVPELGTIHLYKRRRARSMRLSVSRGGAIRVSLPYWVPYKLGIEFAQKRKDWLIEQRTVPGLLVEGQPIGKAHRLRFIPVGSERITTRINSSGEVKVLYPQIMETSSPKVQAAAERAGIRALKLQAESLLPQRLFTLAGKHGFSYSSVDIKRLSSRWGSCSSNNQITLNCYLMQLPWHLIDYVLLHELTHTKIMAHGPAFWTELSSTFPDIAGIRKEMRQYQPRLFIDS